MAPSHPPSMPPSQGLRRWVLSSRTEQLPSFQSSLDVAVLDPTLLPRKGLSGINLSGILASDPFWRGHCECHPRQPPSFSGVFKPSEPDLYLMAFDRFQSATLPSIPPPPSSSTCLHRTCFINLTMSSLPLIQFASKAVSLPHAYPNLGQFGVKHGRQSARLWFRSSPPPPLPPPPSDSDPPSPGIIQSELIRDLIEPNRSPPLPDTMDGVSSVTINGRIPPSSEILDSVYAASMDEVSSFTIKPPLHMDPFQVFASDKQIWNKPLIPSHVSPAAVSCPVPHRAPLESDGLMPDLVYFDFVMSPWDVGCGLGKTKPPLNLTLNLMTRDGEKGHVVSMMVYAYAMINIAIISSGWLWFRDGFDLTWFAGSTPQ